MVITSSVTTILSQKKTDIWSITPEATVYEAITLMAEKNIGALPVVKGGKLVGILSERDYTRKVVLKGRQSRETAVGEIMTENPEVATGDDSIDRCMRTMTQRRTRHLPVVEDGRLVGMISMGDLVNWIISAQNATIDQLERYIHGEYP